MTAKAPALAEVAARIEAHLRRFEFDLTINKRVRGMSDLRLYLHTKVWAYKGRVGVVYVGHQGPSTLTAAEAEQYLQWLDAGGVGTHYALRDASGKVVAG